MFRTITTAVLFALTITAAQAGPAVIRYGDLDLSKPGDSRILAERVQQAAEAVCADWKPRTSGEKAWAFYNVTHEACVNITIRGLTREVMDSSTAHAADLASN
jgi:UrcA family protein